MDLHDIFEVFLTDHRQMLPITTAARPELSEREQPDAPTEIVKKNIQMKHITQRTSVSGSYLSTHKCSSWTDMATIEAHCYWGTEHLWRSAHLRWVLEGTDSVFALLSPSPFLSHLLYFPERVTEMTGYQSDQTPVFWKAILCLRLSDSYKHLYKTLTEIRGFNFCFLVGGGPETGSSFKVLILDEEAFACLACDDFGGMDILSKRLDVNHRHC